MDVDKICAGRNLTQEIPRPDAEKANLTNLIPWTPYKVERLYIFDRRFEMSLEHRRDRRLLGLTPVSTLVPSHTARENNNNGK